MSDGEGPVGSNRRLLGAILVVFLAILGAGVGSFAFDLDGSGPAIQTETPQPTPTENASLSLPADTTFVSVSDVAPGDSGAHTLTLRNDGPGDAELVLTSLRRTEFENGLTDPERAVDDSPSRGELGDNLLVELSFQKPDGDVVPLYDTGANPQPIADVVAAGQTRPVEVPSGEEARLMITWRLPADTGNEVQSDGVEFGGTFKLRANESSP